MMEVEERTLKFSSWDLEMFTERRSLYWDEQEIAN